MGFGYTRKIQDCFKTVLVTRIMKIDPHKNKEKYLKWKQRSQKQIEDISKYNSDLVLRYINDMEMGLNVATTNKKGSRSYIRLNALRQRIIFLAKQFEKRYGLNEIDKIGEEQLHSFFTDMRNGIIQKQKGGRYKSPADFVKDFKAFWHWYQKVNRKQGKTIPDITLDLDTSKSKPEWVYLTEEQIKTLCDKAKYEYKVLIMFLFDSGIRSPTELVNIRVSDLYNECKELNIRDEVSKTFGRRIKLMLSSSLLKDYISMKRLEENDYVFTISPPSVNQYLKRLSKRVFGEKNSPAGETYDKLTMYDFRHCSCCYWLPRYKSESALKFRFGWKKSDKIHYYSEMLGMRDTIQEEDMLIDVTKTELEKRLSRAENESDLMKEEMKALREQSERMMELVERAFGGVKILREEGNQLIVGEEKLFNISLYITCKADTKKELDLLTRKIESELNSLLIIPRQADFRMIQGFKSCLPLTEDSINMRRNITTKGLSAFFPFTSSFFKFDKTGIWFGLNRNNIPIIKDIFNLSNPNGLVLAQSGGGKSYFCKLLITRYLLNGTKVMIIDPQGEYNSIVSHFKGQIIDLSKDSDTMINPLDLMGHDYIEKRLFLMDLMKILLGDLSDIQKAFIDKALSKTYERKGITNNPDTWKNEPPILEDMLEVLKSMEKRATKLEKTTINSLSNRLDMYVSGVFSFFNKKTNINFNNNFVSFDICKMPSQVKPAVMFLVLDYIYMKMKSNLDRKILLIDESWSLLSRAEEAGYIFEIVKTCRKFNLGLLLINQEVEGLLDSKAGKSVLANSSYTVLMRQKPAVIDNICKTFHLSNSERTHVLTAGIGEGLLIMEDDHSEIRVISSPEEHKLITTNPDELNEINKKKPKGRNIKINIDEYERFFRKSQLNCDEIKFLLNKGYKIENRKSLVTNKKEDFLLQPRHNETATHLFVVYDIAEYLEKKGIEVKKYVTKKPDLVFKIGKKNYAIEVETGSALTKVKNLKEKVKLLNENYDKWFFVVTNKNKVLEYKKFGGSVDLRYLKRKLVNLRG